MKLIINSLYSNKEIFLRELISNCADAMNKVKMEAQVNPDILSKGDLDSLEIRIIPDEDEETLTIIDRGIGMSKEELMTNLGTIAHSGTLKFFESVENGTAESDLIGQFGVGFYSSFLVANRVDVTSKRYNTSQYIWSSIDARSYTIAEDKTGENLQRGTKVKLYLTDARYSNSSIIKSLVEKYSQFVSFPIFIRFEKEDQYTYERRMRIEEKLFRGESLDDIQETEVQYDASGNPIVNEDELERAPEYEFVHVNEQPPLWTRTPNATDAYAVVTRGEYEEFFHTVTYGVYRPRGPLAQLHYVSGSAPGEPRYKALLYVPPRLPPYRDQHAVYRVSQLRLYVKKVLITEELVDFLPPYLTYVRGVLEIDDLREPLFESSAVALGEAEKERAEKRKAKGEDPSAADDAIPLNVSREMLQRSEALKTIAKELANRLVQMLAALSERARHEESEDDIDNFDSLWREYKGELTLAAHHSEEHRLALIPVLRFNTSLHPDRLLSLDDYVEREEAKARERAAEEKRHPELVRTRYRHGQTPPAPETVPILYYAAESDDRDKALSFVLRSPFLQPFTNDDRDVLLLFDPVEEAVLMRLSVYRGHPILSVQDALRARVRSFEEQPGMHAHLTQWRSELAPFVRWLSSLFSGRVSGVAVSAKLALGDIERAVELEKHNRMTDDEKTRVRSQLDAETQKYRRRMENLHASSNTAGRDRLKETVAAEREGQNLAVLKERYLHLNSQPCAIVAAAGGLSSGMNRMYQNHSRATAFMKENWNRKIFEINPISPLIQRMNKAYTAIQARRRMILNLTEPTQTNTSSTSEPRTDTEAANSNETNTQTNTTQPLSPEEIARQEAIFKTEMAKLETIAYTLFETAMMKEGYDLQNQQKYTSGIFDIIQTMTGLPHAPVLPEDLNEDFDAYLQAELEEEERFKQEEKAEKKRKRAERAAKALEEEEEAKLLTMTDAERKAYEEKKQKKERKMKKRAEERELRRKQLSHTRPDESYFEDETEEEDPEDAVQRRLANRKALRAKRKAARAKARQKKYEQDREERLEKKKQELHEDEDAEETAYQAEREKYRRKRQIIMGAPADDFDNHGDSKSNDEL